MTFFSFVIFGLDRRIKSNDCSCHCERCKVVQSHFPPAPFIASRIKQSDLPPARVIASGAKQSSLIILPYKNIYIMIQILYWIASAFPSLAMTRRENPLFFSHTKPTQNGHAPRQFFVTRNPHNTVMLNSFQHLFFSRPKASNGAQLTKKAPKSGLSFILTLLARPPLPSRERGFWSPPH